MKLKYLMSIVLLTLFASQGVFAEKLPLETFFKNPQFAGFQVSPNGKELAVLAPINDRMNVVILDLETRKPRAITGVTSQDVSGFMWANEYLQSTRMAVKRGPWWSHWRHRSRVANPEFELSGCWIHWIANRSGSWSAVMNVALPTPMSSK